MDIRSEQDIKIIELAKKHMSASTGTRFIDQLLTFSYALIKINLPIYTNTSHGYTMKDRNFTCEGVGYIQDNNFDYDAGLRVSGDFEEGGLEKYTEMICRKLNSPEIDDSCNINVLSSKVCSKGVKCCDAFHPPASEADMEVYQSIADNYNNKYR